MDGKSSKRMRTRGQGPWITDLPLVVIEKILSIMGAASMAAFFGCKRVCKTFNEAAESMPIYKIMEIDTLMTARFAFGIKAIKREETFTLCRRDGNPNLMFRDGMVKYFYLDEVEAGKELLEQASTLGQRDAKFVLAMMLMAQGQEFREEALKLLNDEYGRSGSNWNVKDTSSKVDRILNKEEGRKDIHFHGCHLACTTHHCRRRITRDFMQGCRWIFDCKFCLWDACFIRFASRFGIDYVTYSL